MGHITQTLRRSNISGPSVEEARILGASSFICDRDPEYAMIELGHLERIIDESMDCSYEKNVKIASFLMEDDRARKPTLFLGAV